MSLNHYSILTATEFYLFRADDTIRRFCRKIGGLSLENRRCRPNTRTLHDDVEFCKKTHSDETWAPRRIHNRPCSLRDIYLSRPRSRAIPRQETLLWFRLAEPIRFRVILHKSGATLCRVRRTSAVIHAIPAALTELLSPGFLPTFKLACPTAHHWQEIRVIL